MITPIYKVGDLVRVKTLEEIQDIGFSDHDADWREGIPAFFSVEMDEFCGQRFYVAPHGDPLKHSGAWCYQLTRKNPREYPVYQYDIPCIWAENILERPMPNYITDEVYI